ncbi:MAG: Regulatory protein AtoC [Myxococcota bacterium]|nr:Regulatory protein AtoC [Myxococcota bacterium]
MKPAILIVDDEEGIRSSLSQTLKIEGYRVLTTASGAEGVRMAAERDVGLVFLDIRMPEMDGLTALEKIKNARPGLEVVIMSGHGTIDDAVRATRLGAYDFLEKPLSSDRVLMMAKNAISMRELREENERIRRELASRYKLVGQSPQMLALASEIDRAAPTNGRVLITGENGTGKELIARAIHEGSKRRAGPFVKLNCAAIPSELIESELFGHMKGSFTGALNDKPGQFERADGGTLFLDEIGDMSLAAQAKVLRVIEEGEVIRVGGTKSVRVDVRLITATNKDLRELIEKGEFREDLYFRLKVIPLRAPPLRERQGDIRVLCEHYMDFYCDEYGRTRKTFSEAALRTLNSYQWPGNVRELRNAMERLAIMAEGDVITEADAARVIEPGGPDNAPVSAGTGSLAGQLEAAEREIILAALRRNEWHVTNTARELGLERSHLYKKMKKLGIDR